MQTFNHIYIYIHTYIYIYIRIYNQITTLEYIMLHYVAYYQYPITRCRDSEICLLSLEVFFVGDHHLVAMEISKQ